LQGGLLWLSILALRHAGRGGSVLRWNVYPDRRP
jgi:hypothetical protein